MEKIKSIMRRLRRYRHRRLYRRLYRFYMPKSDSPDVAALMAGKAFAYLTGGLDWMDAI